VLQFDVAFNLSFALSFYHCISKHGSTFLLETQNIADTTIAQNGLHLWLMMLLCLTILHSITTVIALFPFLCLTFSLLFVFDRMRTSCVAICCNTTTRREASNHVSFSPLQYQFFWLNNNPALVPFVIVPCLCQLYFMGGDPCVPFSVGSVPLRSKKKAANTPDTLSAGSSYCWRRSGTRVIERWTIDL
jgi:hypothetical protein